MSEPTALERRAKRGAGAAFVGALIVATGIFFLPLALEGLSLLLAVVALVVYTVVLLVAGVVNYVVATRFPAVKHLGGPVDFARIATIAFGALAVAGVLAFSANTLSGAAIAVPIALVGVIASRLVSLNRSAIRGADAVDPPRSA